VRHDASFAYWAWIGKTKSRAGLCVWSLGLTFGGCEIVGVPDSARADHCRQSSESLEFLVVSPQDPVVLDRRSSTANLGCGRYNKTMLRPLRADEAGGL
jgi:hypothetical protein